MQGTDPKNVVLYADGPGMPLGHLYQWVKQDQYDEARKAWTAYWTTVFKGADLSKKKAADFKRAWRVSDPLLSPLIKFDDNGVGWAEMTVRDMESFQRNEDGRYTKKMPPQKKL